MRGHVRRHGKGFQAIMYIDRDMEGRPKHTYFPTQATNPGRIRFCGPARE